MPCCDVVNRGAAIYGNKIIFATLDAPRAVALDRNTGKVIWNKQIADYQAGYSATAAPIIVKGMVITGNSGGEFGVVGQVDARDVETGEARSGRARLSRGTQARCAAGRRRRDGNAQCQLARRSLWKTGGGATWLGGTYDPDTNPALFRHRQPGTLERAICARATNLYTASTLAINPDDGKIVWSYQTTPHDGWDFDGVNEFIPFDATINGKKMKLGAKADRNGYFFVLDRTSGTKFVSAEPVRHATDLGQRLRQERSAQVRRGEPARAAVRIRKRGRPSSRRPPLPGRQELDAYGVQQADRDCSTSRPTTGAWISGTSRSPTRRARRLSGFGLHHLDRSPTIISALCARWIRRPARSSGNIRTRRRCGGGVLSTAGNLVFTGTPEGFLKAFDAKTGKRSSGNSRPVRALSALRSPGSRTANNMSP